MIGNLYFKQFIICTLDYRLQLYSYHKKDVFGILNTSNKQLINHDVERHWQRKITGSKKNSREKEKEENIMDIKQKLGRKGKRPE